MGALYLYFALILTSAVRGVFEFPGSAVYSDGHVDPKFIVTYSTTLVSQLTEEQLSGRHMPMTDHEGYRYLCILPELADVEAQILQDQGHQGGSLAGDADSQDLRSPGEEEPEEAGAAAAGEKAEEDLASLLVKLEGTCLYRLEGWWTYELCVNKHLRQYHREQHATEDTVSYYLGRYTDGTRTRAAPSENAAVGLVLEQNYEEGTVCDLTEQDRRATIKFICNTLSTGGGHTMLAEVKEEATCHYQATVLTPLICDHPQFAPKTARIGTVMCYPESAPEGEASGEDSAAEGEGETAESEAPAWNSQGAELPAGEEAEDIERERGVDHLDDDEEVKYQRPDDPDPDRGDEL